MLHSPNKSEAEARSVSLAFIRSHCLTGYKQARHLSQTARLCSIWLQTGIISLPQHSIPHALLSVSWLNKLMMNSLAKWNAQLNMSRKMIRYRDVLSAIFPPSSSSIMLKASIEMFFHLINLITALCFRLKNTLTKWGCWLLKGFALQLQHCYRHVLSSSPNIHANMIASGLSPEAHILNHFIDVYAKSSIMVRVRNGLMSLLKPSDMRP